MRSWEQLEGETLTDFPLWRGIVIKAPQVFNMRMMLMRGMMMMMMMMMMVVVVMMVWMLMIMVIMMIMAILQKIHTDTFHCERGVVIKVAQQCGW